MNNKLNKAATVMAKIFEIIMWLGEAIMIVGLCITLFARNDFLSGLQAGIQEGLDNGQLSFSGFDINLISADGEFTMKALILFFIVGIVELPLVAMIFRNIYLIFKCPTPFSKDNVRMVREIGIFAIAQPIFEVFMSIIAVLVLGGSDVAEISVSMTGVVFGIIVLCLSQYFAYGASLEQEVEGLV